MTKLALIALGVALAACTSAEALPDAHAPHAVPAGEPPICPLGGCATATPAEPPAVLAMCPSPTACAAMAKRACEDGSAGAAACKKRAFELWGAGAQSSLGFVVALFERACDAGDSEACQYGGRMVLDGRGVPRDVTLAEDMLERACDAERVQACVVLAEHYASSAQAAERQRFAWAAICLRGNANACEVLGTHFRDGTQGVPRDAARAARFFERGCHEGAMGACTAIGRAWAAGDGVTRDLARAEAALDKACRGGDSLGCASLGVLVEYGDVGRGPDMARAADLYATACGLGLAYGCLHREMIDEYRARGVPHDPAQADARWRTDCDRAPGASCAFRGVLALDGRGGARDAARGAELMRRACRGAEQQACTWVRQNDE